MSLWHMCPSQVAPEGSPALLLNSGMVTWPFIWFLFFFFFFFPPTYSWKSPNKTQCLRWRRKWDLVRISQCSHLGWFLHLGGLVCKIVLITLLVTKQKQEKESPLHSLLIVILLHSLWGQGLWDLFSVCRCHNDCGILPRPKQVLMEWV